MMDGSGGEVLRNVTQAEISIVNNPPLSHLAPLQIIVFDFSGAGMK